MCDTCRTGARQETRRTNAMYIAYERLRSRKLIDSGAGGIKGYG